MAASVGPRTRPTARRARRRNRPPDSGRSRCDPPPMPNDTADLVLTGGRIFTGDAAKTWAQALAVRGDRIVAVGADRDVRPLDRARHPRHRAARPDRHRRASRTPRPPDPRRARAASSASSTTRAARTSTCAIVAEYAAAHPDREWILGGGWSLADFPGGLPRREDLDRVVPDRPVFLPNRDGHDAWVNTEALELRRHHEGHARPRRRPDRARPGRHAARHAPRGRGGPRRAARARTTVRGGLPRGRCSRASATCTASASRPGRTRGSTPGDQAAYRRAGRVGRAHRARRRGAVVGPRRGAGADRRPRRAARRGPGRAATRRRASSSCSTGSSRTRRRRCSSPTSTPDGDADRQPRHRLHRRRDADARPSSSSTRSGSSRTSTRSATGPSATRSTPSRPPARRTAGPTRGRTSPTSRSSTPTTSRASRQLGALANAQPLWAVLEDQMTELTLPVLGPGGERPPVPVRARSARHGATLVMGSDWSVSTPDPFLEMEVAVTRVSPDMPRRPARRSCPTSGSSSSTRSTAFTAGSAYANHLDETGSLAVGQAGRPRDPRPRPVRRGRGPDRRHDGPRHVRRRRRRARGCPASTERGGDAPSAR